MKILGFGDLAVRQSSDGRSDHVQADNLRVKLEIGTTRHQINYEAESERDRIIGEVTGACCVMSGHHPPPGNYTGGSWWPYRWKSFDEVTHWRGLDNKQNDARTEKGQKICRKA